jgi:hypothetical protein
MALHWLALTLSPDCGFPKWIVFFMLPQNFFIFILFFDFYRKTYNKKPNPEVIESGSKNDLNNNEGGKAKLNDITKKEGKMPVLNYDKTFSD